MFSLEMGLKRHSRSKTKIGEAAFEVTFENFKFCLSNENLIV